MDSAHSSLGILLMAMGGPNSLDEVEPYLTNVRGGRATPAKFVNELKERYRLIGSKSPLLEITQRQARALESFLLKNLPSPSPRISASGAPGAVRRANGLPEGEGEREIKVYVGMRHWSPYIEDTLKQMLDNGAERVIALCMAPQYSSISIGAYFKSVEEAKHKLGASCDITYIKSWATNTFFLQAVSKQIEQARKLFNAQEQENIQILFTAHSLPKRIIESGDPYEEELKASIAGVAALLGLRRWLFAYQSQSPTGEPWLGPSVEEVLGRLGAEGYQSVLVVPIGFVCDHLEILYDIDILFKDYAKKKGIHLERTASLNDSPLLIETLASLVKGSMTTCDL